LNAILRTAECGLAQGL